MSEENSAPNPTPPPGYITLGQKTEQLLAHKLTPAEVEEDFAVYGLERSLWLQQKLGRRPTIRELLDPNL